MYWKIPTLLPNSKANNNNMSINRINIIHYITIYNDKKRVGFSYISNNYYVMVKN